MHGLVVEINLCKVVHAVVEFWLDDIVGEHRVKDTTLHRDTIVVEHLHVVLDILSHLENLLVFK